MGVKGFQKGHIVSKETRMKISKANDGNFIKFASAYDNGHNIQRYLITEIPTPHGKLIDADEIVWFIDNHIALGKKWVEFETIKDMINSLPTIIEAEVSE